MSEEQTPKTISLCRKTTCCPQLVVDGEQVVITDDFGGRVELTTEQLEILIDLYQKL